MLFHHHKFSVMKVYFNMEHTCLEQNFEKEYSLVKHLLMPNEWVPSEYLFIVNINAFVYLKIKLISIFVSIFYCCSIIL